MSIQGPAAKFYFMPSIDPNGRLQGITPEPKLFRGQNGKVVAGDLKSLELLTLYYHFEQLMKIDQQIGILSLNSWPRKVGLRARVINKNQKLSSNNARYSGLLDAYLFDSFILPDLQLTVNGGVIAHEHFHSIFFKMVLVPLSDIITPPTPHENTNISDSKLSESQTVYLSNLLRAWNEGLADVWGWSYSRDTNFVQRSIGFEKTRDLRLRKIALPTKRDFQILMSTARDNTTRLAINYQVGSSLARIIYQSSSNLDSLKLKQAIVRILPKVSQIVKLDPEPHPSLILTLLAREPEFVDYCSELISFIPNEDLEKSDSQSQICSN